MTAGAAAPPAAAGAAGEAGRVGPNAILQLGAALEDAHGDAVLRRVFARAGLQRLLLEPPGGMVDERDAAALFDATFAVLPAGAASQVACEAGRRTAGYLLAHRIPAPARAVLRALPRALAERLLLRAIGRNAWTFAGSGRFRAQPGAPSRIEIADNPLAMPGCAWHVAVLESLFRALVSADASVRQLRCCHAGAPACCFEILHPGHAAR